MNLRQPSPQLFLRRNDGGRDFIPGSFEPLDQFCTGFGTTVERSEVIRIKDEHSRRWYVNSGDTLGPVESSRRIRDHPSTIRKSRANPSCRATLSTSRRQARRFSSPPRQVVLPESTAYTRKHTPVA